MKKICRLISLALLCTMLASSAVILSSCAKIDAEQEWERINVAMDSLTSYESDVRIDMVFYSDGEKIKTVSEGKVIQSDVGGDDYYFYQTSKTDVVCEALNIDESVRDIEAYNEGNYFIYQHTLGGSTQKLYGPMSAEDFVSYKESVGELDIDITDCKSVEKKRNKDGTRSIIYSEFSPSTVKKVLNTLGINKDLFKFNIKDISVTVTYDKEYRVTVMEYKFIFDIYDKAKNKPSLTAKAKYYNYNSAERDYTNISPQQYTYIEDINILTKIEKTLEEKKNATENTIYVNASQMVYSGSQGSSYSERDTVNYGVKDGKYYYDIQSDIGGKEVEITYRDGKQTVKTASVSQENEQTEEEAKEFIDGIIDGARFRKLNVVSIDRVVDPEAVNEEVYVIKLEDFDKTPYQEIVAQLGIGSYSNVEHTVLVQFLNGKLRLLEGTITINNYSASLKVSVHSSNRFMPLSEK